MIEDDATEVFLRLQGNDSDGNTPFNFVLPNFNEYPHLERLVLQLMESQTGGEQGNRGTYTIAPPAGVMLNGSNSTQTLKNIEFMVLELIPDKQDNQWQMLIISNKEEQESQDVSFIDPFGHTTSGTSFRLGRGLKVTQDSHAELGSFYEDEVSTETMLSNDEVISLDEGVLPPHMDGYYATLDYDTIVKPLPTGKEYVDGYLWFDNVIVPNGMYVEVDMQNKAIGIQESDNKDPNVTGGEPVVVAVQIVLKDKAQDNGYIKLELVDKYTGVPLINQYGNPIGITKTVTAGQPFGKLLLTEILKVKGLKEFKIRLTHNLPTGLQVADRVYGDSCVMVQYINRNMQTGDALQQFEIDNDIRLLWDAKYLGKYFYDMRQYFTEDIPIQDISADFGDDEFGLTHFYNSTPLKVGVANNEMTIEDNGKDMAYFNFGHIFDAEETKLLKLGELDINVMLETPRNAFKLMLVEWTGEPDKYTNKIITDNQNDQPIFENNWVENGDKFFTEQPDGKMYGAVANFTISDKAKNAAIIIVPITKQSPSKLVLKGFRIDSTVQDSAYFLRTPIDKNAPHIKYSDRHKVFSMKTPVGASLVRYTISANPTKFPVGTPDNGDADVVDDMVWKDTGYLGEGALKFLNDGIVKSINGNLRIKLGEAAKGSQTIETFFTRGDNPNSPIDGTIMTSMLQFSNKDYVNMGFSTSKQFQVRKDDEIWFWVKTNVDDGAYCESTYATPLSTLDVEFVEEVV